jgi:hypothetical protein
MINRTDWQAIRDAMIADDRAKLGEPPTVDELLAYERGELSPENTERVQRLLVAYPELARAYATSFPPEDAELPAEVIERQWQAFRGERQSGGGARVLQFWRWSAAFAAALAILFGTMLWHAHEEMLRPRVLPDAIVLPPDGRRGGGEPAATMIAVNGESILLVVPIAGDYETYRLDLVGGDGHDRVWSSGELRRSTSDSFNVEVPARALRSGTYQVIAYGLRGNAEAAVGTYTIQVRGAVR